MREKGSYRLDKAGPFVYWVSMNDLRPSKRDAVKRAFADLTPKEARFCTEFVANGCKPGPAAIAAGFANESYGAKLRAKPKVRTALAALQADSASRLLVTADRVLAEYARIAFSRIDDIVEVDGQNRMHLTADMRWQDIPEDAKACVKSIKMVPCGSGYRIEIEVFDKLKALDALSKHLGLFERDNVQKATGAVVQILMAGDGRRIKEVEAQTVGGVEIVEPGPSSAFLGGTDG